MNRIVANSDKLLLALLLAVLLFISVRRIDYAGDGVRHLDHILHANAPALGEPRWLLFPSLLFAVVKPFAGAGLVHSVSQAAKVFSLFNVVCGFIYLVCLRRWLADLPAARRAAVLLLAGGSYVFLTLATNTLEATSAALIAIGGVTFSRFRAGLSDSARLTVAAASLATASLVYQGLLFGFLFLPAIFPVSMLARRRMAFRIAGIALAVPLVTVVLLSLAGDTPRNAARRFAEGESNTEASQQYSRPSAKNLAGVLLVGPTYAFASIPEFRGLTGSLRLLLHRETAFEGIRGAGAWCATAIGIVVAIVLLISRKQFALLIAVGGMMALPMIRMSQYSYMKYYVLLPFLVVLAVPRLGVRFVYPAMLGALLLVSNFGQLRAQRLQSETLRLEVARDLYPRLPASACFLTNGWGPPVPDWRGDSLAWQHILNSGNSETQEQIAAANSRVLRDRLRKLFCDCPAVVTDDFILPNVASLNQELSSFRIAGIPMSQLVVRSAESSEVFRSPKFSVYRFPPEDQRRACEALE